MPGAREMLEALHRQGILLGLVTNKPQRFIETVLDHFGLASSFGVVIGGDAGVAKKPAPDMLFAAIEEFGVEPWNAVMVGDSSSDVEAARAAGIAGRRPARRLQQRSDRESSAPMTAIDGLSQLAAALPRLRPNA